MKTSMVLKAVAAAALVSTAFAVSPSPTLAQTMKNGPSVGGNISAGGSGRTFSGGANVGATAAPTIGSRGAVTGGINTGRMQTSANTNFNTSVRGPSNFQTMNQGQSWNGNSNWNGNWNNRTYSSNWSGRNYGGDWNHRRFRGGSNFAVGFGFGPGYYDDTYAYYDAPYYDDSYAYYAGDDGYVSASVGGGDVAYCMQRYRSYDPASGTFLGYDGLRHPCP